MLRKNKFPFENGLLVRFVEPYGEHNSKHIYLMQNSSLIRLNPGDMGTESLSLSKKKE